MPVQVLLLQDADGEVVARSRPLSMWDARVDGAGDPAHVTPVDAELVKTADGHDLVLRPSMKVLSDPDTSYPLTVDPDISSVTREGDTWYYEGQSSANPHADDYRLISGSFDGTRRMRALFTFSHKSLIGTNVTKATLRVKEYHNEAVACAAKPTLVFPMESEPIGLTYWGNQPDYSPNDLRFRTRQLFNHGFATPNDPGCAMDFEDIDVTAAVNGWAGEHIGEDLPRQGLVVRAENELAVDQSKRFCSVNFDPTVSYCGDASVVPVLSLTYRADLGSQSWYSMTDHELNDRSSVSVNNNNGNLVVGAGDANVKGVGLDLGISRAYNSQADPADAGALGTGWSLSVGPDVWLEKKSTYRYDYHGPGGTVLGSFVRKSSTSSSGDYNKFHTPTGGAGADLEQESSGAFTLKFRGSQTKYVFGQADSNGNAYLRFLKDRSDNQIEFTYSGSTSTGKPKLSTITDSSARAYTVTYTGDFITKIANTATGPGLREWQYGYTGGYLTSYTDPNNQTTNYAYEDVTSGPDLLDTITNPANQSGKRPTTTIVYGYDADTDVNQVLEVSYRYGDGTDDTYDYTWDYRDARPAECDDEGDGSDDSNKWTVVTDPNAHDTTYCFKSRTDSGNVNSKTWVYDALGHAKSVEYNADNGPINVTDPSGQGVTDGSTVATYSTNIPDQLTKVTAPRSDGADDQATTGFEYNAGSGVAGGDYLPTAVKSDNGTCNRFGYDDKGRTTDAYTGITASNDTASNCGSSGGSGVRGFHRDYDNATGNVIKSWDANAGSSSPADADATIYTYWATTDTGYVAGTKDQLKSIRKPGGDCAATVAAGRKLCTSYTWDGAGRVTSVTNGAGKKTTYTHDKLDRTTGVYFDGSTSCNLDSSNCVVYTYDAEGNLVSRVEAGLGQTSQFVYDRLNRQVGIYNPTGLLQPNDEIGMAYDGTGNLVAYAMLVQGVYDVAYYYYDAANRLNGVGDVTAVGGTGILINSDEDGRTESIIFPKPSGTDGVKVDYDYTKGGKPKTLDIEKHSGAVVAGFDYDYTWQLYGGLLEVETSQMRKRTVTGSLSNLNTDVTYSYSASNELTGANAATGTDYTYEYDNVSNVTKEVAGSTTTHYGYARAGQLCWQGPNNGTKLDRACPATPSGNTTVTHDPAGNITGTTSDPVVYNNRDQVTTIGGAAMTYRDLGNDLRSTTGTTRTVAGPMGITATVDGTAVTFYTRDPQGTILNAHNTAGTVNYVTEFNGSVAALFNPAGTPVGSYKYAPYGATTVANHSGTTQAGANRFRYISGYQDKTSTGADGYYKLGARYYDARGHFTQPDALAGTINDPKTMTAYNYAGGDPINFSDPSGNSFFDEVLKGAARGYGIVSNGAALVGVGSSILAGNGREAGALAAGLVVGGIVGTACGMALGGGAGAVFCAGVGAYVGAGAYNTVKTGNVNGLENG